MFDQILLHEAKLGQFILMPSDGSVSFIDSEVSLNMLPKVTFQCQLMGYELPIVMEDITKAMFYFTRN